MDPKAHCEALQIVQVSIILHSFMITFQIVLATLFVGFIKLERK